MDKEEQDQQAPEEPQFPPRNHFPSKTNEVRIRGIFSGGPIRQSDIHKSNSQLALQVGAILLTVSAATIAIVREIIKHKNGGQVSIEEKEETDTIKTSEIVIPKPITPADLSNAVTPAKSQPKPAKEQLAIAGELLTSINWESGLHHDLAAATTIVVSKNGKRYAGIVLDEKHMLTTSEIENSDDLSEVKTGRPYKLRTATLNKDGKNKIGIVKNSNLGISLVEFNEAIFEKDSAPKHSNEKIDPGDYLLLCGNPKNSAPRMLNGGEVQEILENGIILLGVEADDGYLGAPVTNLKGEIIGIVIGKTEKPFTYTFRNPKKPEKEITSTILFVQPISSLNPKELAKILIKN